MIEGEADEQFGHCGAPVAWATVQSYADFGNLSAAMVHFPGTSRATASPTPRARGDAELRAANRDFYDRLWAASRLVEPDRFNTWPLVRPLAADGWRRLEVAPGMRPRLPLEGSYFVDLSEPAANALSARGAAAAVGLITALPFRDGTFDIVCALDVVEHVDDDDTALAELSRVAAPGATLLLAVPLHPHMWTAFDDAVGHRRRYEPQQLLALLGRHGFTVMGSAIYGMQPRSSRLLDLGLWFLTHRRERAMWWYNRVIMPLALRWQKPLLLRTGMLATDDVDSVLLVCREAGPTPA
jgi:SAM-dependent methyltransferase